MLLFYICGNRPSVEFHEYSLLNEINPYLLFFSQLHSWNSLEIANYLINLGIPFCYNTKVKYGIFNSLLGT